MFRHPKMIIEITLTIGMLILGYAVHRLYKNIKQKDSEIKKYKFEIKSAYVKFGKTFEHFAPFSKDFTEEERRGFIFVGMPIDGVIFDEDKITFVEVKSGKSQLSKMRTKLESLN